MHLLKRIRNGNYNPAQYHPMQIRSWIIKLIISSLAGLIKDFRKRNPIDKPITTDFDNVSKDLRAAGQRVSHSGVSDPVVAMPRGEEESEEMQQRTRNDRLRKITNILQDAESSKKEDIKLYAEILHYIYKFQQTEGGTLGQDAQDEANRIISAHIMKRADEWPRMFRQINGTFVITYLPPGLEKTGKTRAQRAKHTKVAAASKEEAIAQVKSEKGIPDEKILKVRENIFAPDSFNRFVRLAKEYMKEELAKGEGDVKKWSSLGNYMTARKSKASK
jgi:hypothetical protein